MQDLLTEIERSYSFELPELYKRLHRDGMLDWFLDGGLSNPNWRTAIYPRLRQKPPVLLYAQDFELYAPETLPTMTDLADNWGPKFRFVPLGQTGGGDLYAFCPTLADNGETPITLTLHDDDNITVLAPSLEAFIFREMLDRATSFDEYDLAGCIDFEEFRADLLRAAESIRSYLRPAWGSLLEEVYRRPLQQETIVLPRRRYTVDTLLPRPEFEQLLRREMDFPLLDKVFTYFED